MKDKGAYIIGAVIFMLAYFGWNLYKDYKNKPSFYQSDDLSSYQSAKREGWDLWIYSTESPDTDYVIDEFFGLTKELCLTEGLARTRTGGSYQCGKNCYTVETTLGENTDVTDVCEIMCEKSGCRE